MHESHGTFRFHVDIRPTAQGRVYHVAPDGTRAEVPVTTQKFARITRESVRVGALLYNPAVKDLHKVVSTDPLVITVTNGTRQISWADAAATLAVVL